MGCGVRELGAREGRPEGDLRRAWGLDTSEEQTLSRRQPSWSPPSRPGPSSTLGSLTLGSRRPAAVWAITDEGDLPQEAPRPLKERDPECLGRRHRLHHLQAQGRAEGRRGDFCLGPREAAGVGGEGTILQSAGHQRLPSPQIWPERRDDPGPQGRAGRKEPPRRLKTDIWPQRVTGRAPSADRGSLALAPPDPRILYTWVGGGGRYGVGAGGPGVRREPQDQGGGLAGDRVHSEPPPHPRRVTCQEGARPEGRVQGRPLSRQQSLHSQHCSTLENRLFPWQPPYPGSSLPPPLTSC